MAFTGHEDHTITLAEGAALTKVFRKNFPNQPKGYFFSKDTLQSILDQTDAVGIRFYFGQEATTSATLKLVFVAAKANEDDITAIVGDGGMLCPPACGTANSLNS